MKICTWFHRFIFDDALNISGSYEVKKLCGCIVVMLTEDYRSINIKGMKKIRDDAEKFTGKYVPGMDMSDSIVVEEYLLTGDKPNKNPGHYLVIHSYGNINFKFPIEEEGVTFKEYFTQRYEVKVTDDDQPLVKIIHHSREIDCRSHIRTRKISRTISSIPEILKFRRSPQSLTLSQ